MVSAALFAILLITFSFPAGAQMGSGRRGMGGGGFGGMKGGGSGGMQGGGSGFVESRTNLPKATGLVPVFPAGYACEPISSPFGSPTRYDGSQRRTDRNSGLHGGMDISLDEGTPLLAVADGEVIAKGEGGQLEGIFLWLRHSPSDTGLPFWSFTKYQHLSKMPELNEGDRVRAGQAVALSGSTGTAGGHYGFLGYPHLHLSHAAGPSENFMRAGRFKSMVKARGAHLSDAMILYLKGIGGLDEVYGLPGERKRVPVAVVGRDGAIHPPGSKVVWPVRCEARPKN
jgi:hypothetical protein